MYGDTLPRELAQHSRDEHQDRHEGDQLGLPLQHPQVPPREDARPGDFPALTLPGASPHRGICREYDLRTGNEPGFRERPTAPGKAVLVPPGERRDRDAVTGRMDEPALAQIDAHVV